MRRQAKCGQFCVFGVVVMFLGLDPRIGQVINGHTQSEPLARDPNHFREFEHGELLGELIKYPELSSSRRIKARQLNAAYGVANVEESAGLATLAIDGDRMIDRCLHAEAVESSSKDLVVVKSIDQS